MFSFKVFRFSVQEQLPATEDEACEYVQRLTELLDARDQGLIFSHLYENLSILDAKAASLLQFNSILIAVFSIFLSEPETPDAALYVAAIGILATLVSCYLLLEVVWVHWSTAGHMITPEAHGLKLLEVRKERTILYRLAWNWSKGAVLSVLILAILIVGFRLV